METSNIALLALVCCVVTVHAYKTEAPDFSNEALTTLPPLTARQQVYILLLNFLSGNLPPGAPLPAGLLGSGLSMSSPNVPTMPPNMPILSGPFPNMPIPNMPIPNLSAAAMPATPAVPGAPSVAAVSAIPSVAG